MSKKRDYTKFSNPKITVAETVVEIETPVVEEEIEKNEEKFGVVSNCDKLNVREIPAINGKIIALINNGETVEIFEEESTDVFYKVCTAAGIEGFCMKKFITIKP